ncbi:hypothetical protein OIO90_006304 [Microbotryomycetes sp. JL221]|nr:hypothetical protein OIO90_006304 [Microbotryomycetes sp. JL221]
MSDGTWSPRQDDDDGNAAHVTTTTTATATTGAHHSHSRWAPRSRLTRSTMAPPSVSMSSLTTRSTSATRLNQLSSEAVQESHYNNDRRARSHDRHPISTRLSPDQTPPSSTADTTPRSKRGRTKAVAFELGTDSINNMTTTDDTDHNLNGPDPSWLSPSQDSTTHSWPSFDDIIDAQIQQPVTVMRRSNLDPLLRYGISDYSFVLNRDQTRPRSPNETQVMTDDQKTKPPNSTTEPEPHPDRVCLGKGKFSQVLLVKKRDTEFALKHTPLHSHHPLIATRLLREPTILAQLLPHPNLVKVYETIRTPGHFYLVEESLQSSITLEALVSSSSDDGVLPLDQAWSVLEQLASVVHSLHEPLRVCHRDIKPENILIRVEPGVEPESSPTLLLKLLDFGLATHFSASEPKLTTCCGSPAYHAPELWRGLREPSGTVKYWGPEIDVWCVGLTLLRCLTPHKYPLGISHSSLKAMSDKVVDSLCLVQDDDMRQLLSGFLHMDGNERIKCFKQYCETEPVKRRANFVDSGFASDLAPPMTPGLFSSNQLLVSTPGPTVVQDGVPKKDFKSTTFIETEPKFALELPIASSSDVTSGPAPLEVCPETETAPLISSRTSSRVRLSNYFDSQNSSREDSPSTNSSDKDSPDSMNRQQRAPDMTPDSTVQSTPTTPLTPYFDPFHPSIPPPVQIVLNNPADETAERATSFIKYALRCAGILYHVCGYGSRSPPGSQSSLSRLSHHSEWLNSQDDCVTYLECVLVLPLVDDKDESRASNALKAALNKRPTLLRAHTSDATSAPSRSSSTPPTTNRTNSKSTTTTNTTKKDSQVRATTFFVRICKGPYQTGVGYGFGSRKNNDFSSPNLNGTPCSNNGRRTTSRRRDRTSNEKQSVYISLSDERGLNLIKQALSFDASICQQPDKREDVSIDQERRGRTGRDHLHQTTTGGRSSSVNTGPVVRSSSRDDYKNRKGRPFYLSNEKRSNSSIALGGTSNIGTDRDGSTPGLAMAMGPLQTTTTTTAANGNGSKGFFDYVGDKIGGMMTTGHRTPTSLTKSNQETNDDVRRRDHQRQQESERTRHESNERRAVTSLGMTFV